MPKHSADLDLVFRALADPTRRAVLQRLGRGDRAMSDLAAPFAMALPSFMQHLEVLERSGLVRSRKSGRVRTFRLAPRRLDAAERWMDHQRSVWNRRLDRMDRYLLNLHRQEKRR